MPAEHQTKVLLIDDEKFLLDMYALKFLRGGYQVFTSRSVDEAITALTGGYVPEVIVFDITMPEHNGYEFLERLATLPQHKNALKVALTNEGQDAEIARMAELGTDAHLLKAKFTPNEIVQQVTALLEKKRGGTAA